MCTQLYERKLLELYRRYSMLNSRIVLCKLYLNNPKIIFEYYSNFLENVSLEENKKAPHLKFIKDSSLRKSYIKLLHFTHNQKQKYPIHNDELAMYLNFTLTPEFYQQGAYVFFKEMTDRVILQIKMGALKENLGLTENVGPQFSNSLIKPFKRYLLETVKLKNIAKLVYDQLTGETIYTPIKVTYESNS